MAQRAYEIPLSAEPQQFIITLAEKVYNLQVRYCHVTETWVLNILDGDEIPVLMGVPMVTGVDILGQHQHLGFGGQLRVQSDGDTAAVPGFADLGVNGHLYFVVED